MLSRKRVLKALRLILCFAVLITASSMFLTIEPMASENVSILPEEMSIPTEDTADPEQQPLPEEATVLEAATMEETPVIKHRSAISLQEEPHAVDTVQVNSALASLPEEGTLTTDTEENVEETAVETETQAPTADMPPAETETDSESSAITQTPSGDPSASNSESSAPAQPETSQPPQEESSSASNEESSSTQPGSSADTGYSDLEYLAAICQIEAGYHYEGCLAVANVILNRVNAGFGSSVYDVIYAPGQFATGQMRYYLENGTSATALQAASAALSGTNNIGSYLYFNGTAWLDPETLDVPYVVIGGNCFY